MALARHILHALIQAGIAQADGGVAAEEQLVDFLTLLQASQCTMLPMNRAHIRNGTEQPLMTSLQCSMANIQSFIPPCKKEKALIILNLKMASAC